MPGCAARIVQVPVATKLTVLPDTVHLVAVLDVKVMARPLVALALTVKGGSLRALLVRAAKLMVWLALLMMTVAPTAMAAVYCGLPA